MKRRVEGYEVAESDIYGGKGIDEAWLADLREEARTMLIRRIVLERIRSGGFGGAPRPVDLDSSADGFPPGGGLDDVYRDIGAPSPGVTLRGLLRDVAIGVGISVFSAWLCVRWGIGRRR